MDSRLRIGLLLDSIFLPAWAITTIKRIACSTYAELSLVILNRSQQSNGDVKRTFSQDPVPWLFRAYNTIDERIFLHSPNALTKNDASEIISPAPVIEMVPVDEYGEQHFSAEDVEVIKTFQLDILVKIGFGRLRGDILSAATYGIWTYRWGDPSRIKDGLTGFWEVVRWWPETGVALQQLSTTSEQNVTLFKSWFSTYPYSPARNQNCILWAVASFLPRQVERLQRLGGEKFFQELKNNSEGNPRAIQSNDIPSNLSMAWIILKLAFRNLLEIYRRIFYRERWKLLFHFGYEGEKDISAFREISPPKDRFWADPHIVYKEPDYYIFIEEYPYRARKGHISVIQMNRNGMYKQPIRVLGEDCHLSFPFVFEWMGHYYMIPESSERKTVDLYECIRFPDHWHLKINLMKDVVAVDSTAFYRDGKWWLFTALAEQKAAAPQVELFIFYSDELLTNRWHPHPMNPVVSDVKKARGAGGIFIRDGRIFRPSQDCSKTYGYGFDLNEIVVLTENEYYERTVTSVRPDSIKKVIATHTYAYRDDLTVVDALSRLPIWLNTA